MECILMNKYKEVIKLEYNEVLYGFDKIYEIINIDYAPLIIYNQYNNDSNLNNLLKVINEWFKGRGIPSLRDNINILLEKLNIDNPSELLNKSFALSLSDQYYIKPFDLDIKYDDVNFFDNSFDYMEFLEASLSLGSKTINKEVSLKTPNNTTDGMLKKAWIIDDNKRYLLKGGYKNDLIQPFNEVLASDICKYLGFNHVEYKIDIYKDTIVSKCPCFITNDTEFITANQIMNNKKKNYNLDDYEEYIKELENHGIENAREKLENMYILDYLIMNEDRHLNNFGIIRDVNTLKWIDVCPIFDNGQSLNIPYYDEVEAITNGNGRFFYEVKPFDEIIKIVEDIKRIDIKKLNNIVYEFDNLLHKYQHITNISDKRINVLCSLLQRQVNKLRTLIEEEL